MNPPTFTGFNSLLSTTPVPSPGFRQLQKMPVPHSLARGGYGVCFNAGKHQQPSLYICWAPGGLSLRLIAHFGLTIICWPCSERSSTCSLSGWQQQGVQGEVGGSQGVPCLGTETHTHIAQPGKGDPSAWETLGIAGMPWDHISFFSQRFSSPYVFNCSAHSFNIFSPFILSCFQIWKSFKRFWQEIHERVGSIFLPVSYFDVALLFLFPSFFFSFGTSAFIC